MSKIKDVVKNVVVKEDVYNPMIKNIEDKIPDITNLATNTTLNARLNEVNNKIPNGTNFATTADLNGKTNEVENKLLTLLLLLLLLLLKIKYLISVI